VAELANASIEIWVLTSAQKKIVVLFASDSNSNL
jgi:hypothetical protein